jgi:hypothetical protein
MTHLLDPANYHFYLWSVCTSSVTARAHDRHWFASLDRSCRSVHAGYKISQSSLRFPTGHSRVINNNHQRFLIPTKAHALFTMASKAANTGVDPLKDLLGDVLARLEALEANAGVAVAVTSATKSPVPVKATFQHGTLAGVRYTSTFRSRRSIPHF